MAGGTRLGFRTSHQGGAYGYSFKVRYHPTKFGWLYFYLPFGWTTPPTVGAMPTLPLFDYRRGGTLYNPALDALQIEQGSFAETIALSVSNVYYGVVVTSDYLPGGDGITLAEDVERVYWPDTIDMRALATQHIRTIADDTSLGMDRPITREQRLTLEGGTSSGAWQTLLAQIQPDGYFEYSRDTHSTDPLTPRYSHCAGPIVAMSPQTDLSMFHQGGAGYTNFTAYAAYSWAGAYVGPGDETIWANVPMSVKRQLDFGEYARLDNPRCKEIGVYFIAQHVGNIPRSNVTNALTGATSYGVRHWRFNGGLPAPIATIRPVVDNVQAIASTKTFRRSAGSWVTDGYLAGDVVASDGFGVPTNNEYVVLSISGVGNVDLNVDDPGGEIIDSVAAIGKTIAGGGVFDLHDEAYSYVGYRHLVNAGSTKSRLRAGAVNNTNPDGAATGYALATIADVESWLETDWGWVKRNT